MQPEETLQSRTARAESRHHLKVGLWLLGGLLFLRFPFLVTFGMAYEKEALPAWVIPTFMGGTYLLTAILIWCERERLREFWIDLTSAIVWLCQMWFWPLGIALFVAMRRSRARFPRPPPGLWQWALAGAFLAVAAQLLVQALNLNPVQPRVPVFAAGLGFLLRAVVGQMTFAGAFEEPLFRGFLWGYLRRANWKDGWTWLFQAALFTLGHIYYLRHEAFCPWLARMLIPSLVIGLVAWRARSITAGMVAHGFTNATADMLLHTRSLAEAVRTTLVVMGFIAVVFVALSAARRCHLHLRLMPKPKRLN